MRWRVASSVLVGVTTLVCLLAGCAVPEGSEARPVDSDIAALLTPEVTPTPTPQPTVPAKSTRITWVRGEHLQQVQRLLPVKSREQQLDTAFLELTRGPRPTELRRGLSTLLPPDLVVEGAVHGMRVRIDVERNNQTEQGKVTLAIGQLATTALSIPQVREVVFAVDGDKTEVSIPGGKERKVVVMRDYRQVLRPPL